MRGKKEQPLKILGRLHRGTIPLGIDWAGQEGGGGFGGRKEESC